MVFKLQELIGSIHNNLAYIGTAIKIQNSSSMTDCNRVAEDLFKEVLNILYGWDLVNANSLQVNYPAIDLHDSEKRICVQVTSERGAAKLRKTFEKIDKNNLSNLYDTVYFMILSPSASPSMSNATIPYKVIDLSNLGREIANRPLQTIEYIDTIIKNHLSISAYNHSTGGILPSTRPYTPAVTAKKISDYFQFDDEIDKTIILKEINGWAAQIANLPPVEREFLYYMIKSGYIKDTHVMMPKSSIDNQYGHTWHGWAQSLEQKGFIVFDDEYYESFDRQFPAFRIRLGSQHYSDIDLDYLSCVFWATNSTSIFDNIFIRLNFTVFD